MAQFLRPDQLTRMRGQVAQMLPDMGTILGPAFVSDGAGGNSQSYAAVAGGTVSCRVDPYLRRGSVMDVAGAEGLVIDYVLTLPFDAPVAPDYQISTGGQTYDIVALSAEHSQNVSRRAYVTRVG